MKALCTLIALILLSPVAALAENWTNAPIIDTQCSAKASANPDAHTRSCAMACAKSGFGILDKDGQYLKFDANGNQQAKKLLQNTSEKDHLRVDVSGTKEGNVIHVDSLKLL